MKELDKSQIVLLTLLVSFVTSLATGIVTVSLMEQGVSPVTNTVNQIVERTKEIIVRVQDPQDPIVITETEMVIVQQSDLVAAAVSKNKDSSIILYKVAQGTLTEDVRLEDGVDELAEDVQNEPKETPADMTASAVVAVNNIPAGTLVFVSRAAVLAGGILAADSSVLEMGAEYVVLGADGQRVMVKVHAQSGGIALLDTYAGTSTSLGDVTQLARGQAVIVLSGTNRLRVTTGIVSDIILNDGSIVAVEIDRTIDTPGSMLISIDGELIGMSTGISRADGSTWFTSANVIEKVLSRIDNTDV